MFSPPQGGGDLKMFNAHLIHLHIELSISLTKN